MTRWRGALSALTLGLWAWGAGAACGPAEASVGQPEATPASTLGQRIVTSEAQPAPETTLVTLPAEVVVPSHAVQALGPPLPGRLTRWHVTVGAQVRAGAPLAELTSPELADLEAAEAELARVVRDRRRILGKQRQHVATGMQPVQSSYEAELALGEAEARLGAVRKQLEARRTLSAHGPGMTWTWTAPAAGVVREISCALGATVGAEVACVTLLDASAAELRVRVPERHTGRLGPETRLTWQPTAAWPDALALDLQLSRLDPVVDPRSRTRAAFFTPGPEAADAARWMVVGATGPAALRAPAEAGAVLVPAAALTRIDGQPAVLVAAPGAAPDAARPLTVSVLGRSDAGVVVRGDPLAPGASVVTRGVFLLKSVLLLEDED